MAACTPRFSQQSNSHRVLVIHSGDSTGEDGITYHQYMKKKFHEAGVQVNIRHFYANLIHTPDDRLIEESALLLERLKKFNPEVVILDGNGITQLVTEDISYINPDIELAKREAFSSLPIVFGGITSFNQENLKRHNNITGFIAPIDLNRNAQLIRQLTGSQSILIELDHFDNEQILRNNLVKQLKSPEFENNSDFHVISFDPVSLANKYPKKTVVTLFSSAEPETNVSPNIDTLTNDPLRTKDRQILYQTLHTLKGSWLLQVKEDIFSRSLLRHTEHPQFTAIRNGFNDPNEPRLLGGYFPSMQTQISDVVEYAVRIINGVPPSQLPMKEHEAHYYIDYNALQKWTATDISYKDLKKGIEVINIPFYLHHPWVFWTICIITGILTISFIILIGYFIITHKSTNERLMTRIMRHEKIRRLMLIESQSLIYWFIDNDIIKLQKSFTDKYGLPQEMTLDQFGSMVMIDSLMSWKLISSYGDEMGANKVRIHLQLPPDQSHWLEFRFNSTRESHRMRSLMGTAIYCDEAVDEEQHLNKLNEISHDSLLKQSFLSNMNHSIRTPLNAVLGFAQLIAADDMNFSAEELQEFCNQVHINSDNIIKVIDQTLEDSRIEIGEVQLKPIRTSAREFITSLYHVNKMIIPSHLQLRLMCDAEDAYVMMAPAYTRTVIDAFINNAVKFTITGHIEIGYKVLIQENEVMFYCHDTGIGLSEENKNRVFDRYFKVFAHDKGTGVGLTIAKIIIEKQDGQIGVDSKEGAGSIFWFKLKKI